MWLRGGRLLGPDVNAVAFCNKANPMTSRKVTKVTGVCHMCCSKANKLWHIWTTRVTCSDHRSWPFLVLLDSSCRYFFNDTGDVVIGVLKCFRDLFLFFFLSLFLYLLSLYCKLCQFILILKRVVYVICDFLNCDVLFY